jgi:hypothetical protein
MVTSILKVVHNRAMGHITVFQLELNHGDVTNRWATFKLDVTLHFTIQLNICYTNDCQLQYCTPDDEYSR